ncbi:MAG: division/cell wall cluster transcriptional repressor MraZ [Deltaproteobacteria bacterium RBG_16_49_23]|nr:MAG: division/cell wall cluster transcriptional repressor MraZ [Deltaproteobacteria bacterium RBG_16_49_23]
MFRGRYEHALDTKGRISIPSKFREILNKKYDDRLVITNFDHCLLVFPYEEWNQLVEQKVGSFSILRKDTSAFLRFFYSSAIDCAIDTQGRLLIPPTLRDYANLKRDVVLMGEGRFIEIFAKEQWQAVAQQAEEGFDQIRDTLGNMGI